MGHSELECSTPVGRDDKGKLPYDVQLRAPDERRRRIPSFAAAAAESFGSGSSSVPNPPRHNSRLEEKGSKSGPRRSDNLVDESEEPEVQSPLKQNLKDDGMNIEVIKVPGASKCLNLDGESAGSRQQARKRKSKGASLTTQTPDLNIPVGESNAIVPSGLVSARVNQLGAGAKSGGKSMSELLKKQKRGNSQNDRSAAAAIGSPRRAP